LESYGQFWKISTKERIAKNLIINNSNLKEVVRGNNFVQVRDGIEYKLILEQKKKLEKENFSYF